MKFKVLMIDDEEILCEFFRQALERTGQYVVGYATSGKTGLLMAEKGNPDVILLDICMPKMNGIEILKALKSTYPLSEVPVIMLSGLQDSSTKQECYYQYGEEYIEKPVDIAQLKVRLEAVLRRCGKIPPLAAAIS
mgnify:CR=1 FL=1